MTVEWGYRMTVTPSPFISLNKCPNVLASNVFSAQIQIQVRVDPKTLKGGIRLIKRKNVVKFRLNDDELIDLNDKVLKSGLSRERFIRHVLSGTIIKEKPSLDYQKLISEFNYIGNNLNQLVRNSYSQPYQNNAIEILNLLKEMIQNMDKQVRGKAK